MNKRRIKGVKESESVRKPCPGSGLKVRLAVWLEKSREPFSHCCCWFQRDGARA
jgi:hypothetical protein